MTKRTIIAVIVLLGVLGIVWLVQRNRQSQAPPETILSVSAFNQTKNADPSTASNEAGDAIVYTLTVENPSDEPIKGYVVETNIQDVQELATLVDAQGANYNPATGSLIWTPLDIPARDSIQKKFTVRISGEIPKDSDKSIGVKFGNELVLALAAARILGNDTDGRGGERTSAGTPPADFRSPQTGPSEWLSILLALSTTFGISVYRFKRKLA